MQIMARYKRLKCPHCGEIEEDEKSGHEKSEDEPIAKRNKILTPDKTIKAQKQVEPTSKEGNITASQPSKLEEEDTKLAFIALDNLACEELFEKDLASFKPILPVDINHEVGSMLDVNVTLASDPSRFKVCIDSFNI